jgi:hypothetical protein
LVLEREDCGAQPRGPRPDPKTTPEDSGDTMHPLLLSNFSRGSLALALLALSALCAWRQPTDAGAASRPTTAPHVAPAAELEPAVDALVFDCNQNGVDDSIDIALGASSDQNHNGVPDECEATAGEAAGAPAARR